jgi:hypothetical protein
MRFADRRFRLLPERISTHRLKAESSLTGIRSHLELFNASVRLS